MKYNNSRRVFLKKSNALVIGAMASWSIIGKIFASQLFLKTEMIKFEEGKFLLPVLPYSYDSLEPHIDKLTMEIHHSKHHQGYVNNLNKALETLDKSLLESPQALIKIFDNIINLPPAIRNNAGGHYNHSLFWIIMKPNGGGKPKGKLASTIDATWGSFDEFKKQFTDASLKHFGSGWVWLVVNKGKLAISATSNQDNPLMNMDSILIKGTPILALDIWEHAYYLKNQNRRAEYIASWWNVLNWEVVESLFTINVK